MSQSGESRREVRRFIYIITPLALLALVVILTMLFLVNRPGPPAGDAAAQPSPSVTEAPAGDAVEQPAPTAIALATPWEILGITAVPTDAPTDAATAVPTTEPTAPRTPVEPIEVQGPPDGSRFQAGEPVTFFWLWPGDLQPGEQFEVVVDSGGESRSLGVVDEANFGRAYRLTAALPDAGDWNWSVALLAGDDATRLSSSPARSVRIVAP